MALISYNQQNDAGTFNVGCSGQTAGATTANRRMDSTAVGGTEVSVDPGNNVTRACFVFDGTAPGSGASWDAGDWVVRVNHTTMDGGTQLTRIDICDFDGTSSYTTIVSDTSPGHTRGATGVLARTINQGSAHTPQSAANSRPFIVLTYNNNDAHGGSGLGITPDQVIDTPIDDGAAGGWGPALGMQRNRLVIPI